LDIVLAGNGYVFADSRRCKRSNAS